MGLGGVFSRRSRHDAGLQLFVTATANLFVTLMPPPPFLKAGHLFAGGEGWSSLCEVWGEWFHGICSHDVHPQSGVKACYCSGYRNT